MTKPKLIGLYSPVMQSGKTYAANYLSKEYGYRLVKFAGPLKAMLRTLYREMEFDEETVESMLEGDLKEAGVCGLAQTSRRMHQTLGTEWGRKMVHQDIWVQIACRQISKLIWKDKVVVVDDLRLPNEFDALRAVEGSILVKVIRPGETPYAAHGSEGLLEDRQFDYTINNSGTLEDLYRMVDEIVELGADHYTRT